MVSAIWIAIALIIGISFATHRHKIYYGDTQYCTCSVNQPHTSLPGADSYALGCWITSEYPVQRIVLEYLWMWITAFANIALYIPMALAIFYDATVAVNGWHVRIVKNPKSYRDDRRLEMRIAIKMLVYPAVYTVTVCATL